MRLKIAAATWPIERGAISRFTKLLWCLLPVTTVLYEAVQGLIFQAHQSHDLLV